MWNVTVFGGITYAVAITIQHFVGGFALQERPQIAICHARKGA
jgi:hypothetical protein